MFLHGVTIAGMAVSLVAAAKANETGILGFNSGAFKMDNSAKKQADFEKEMNAAQKLHGSPGLFNSMRLYTNIQHETDKTPIEAFDAALSTNTSLLLGIWCSQVDSIDNELDALLAALEDKGQAFADLVVGISVGSEDLYRNSKSGIKNDAGVGAGPDTILGFIKDTRDALDGTLLEDKPVGHLDTWSAWGNSSNHEVLQNLDFAAVSVYPYYEYDKNNSFDNVTGIFDYIYGVAKSAADDAGVPLWIGETGWPLSGPKSGDAVASEENAAAYWETIGCELFGRTNVWWYDLGDSNPDNEESFAISDDFSTTPEFNLTCPADSGAPVAINTESLASGFQGSWVLAVTVVASIYALVL